MVALGNAAQMLLGENFKKKLFKIIFILFLYIGFKNKFKKILF